jgi:hypothetical protein
MEFSEEDQKDLMERFQADVDLFRRQSLMDYSLLLAVSTDQVEEKERKTTKEKVGDNYIDNLKKKYKDNKNVFVSPRGYIYNIGIVDYLQEFNFMKRLENRFKKFRFGASKMYKVSAIDPEPYAIRYMHFIKHKVLHIKE